MVMFLAVTKEGKVHVTGGKRDGFPTIEVFEYHENQLPVLVLVLPEGNPTALETPMEEEIKDDMLIQGNNGQCGIKTCDSYIHEKYKKKLPKGSGG